MRETISPEQPKNRSRRTGLLIAGGLILLLLPTLIRSLPKGASCDGQRRLSVDFGVAGTMYFFPNFDGNVIGTYAGGPPDVHIPLLSGEKLIFRADDNEQEDSLDFNVVRIGKETEPRYATGQDGSVVFGVKVLPNASEVIKDCTGGVPER